MGYSLVVIAAAFAALASLAAFVALARLDEECVSLIFARDGRVETRVVPLRRRLRSSYILPAYLQARYRITVPQSGERRTYSCIRTFRKATSRTSRQLDAYPRDLQDQGLEREGALEEMCRDVRLGSTRSADSTN